MNKIQPLTVTSNTATGAIKTNYKIKQHQQNKTNKTSTTKTNKTTAKTNKTTTTKTAQTTTKQPPSAQIKTITITTTTANPIPILFLQQIKVPNERPSFYSWLSCCFFFYSFICSFLNLSIFSNRYQC